MEGKAFLEVVRLPMTAAIVLLAPVDVLNALPDFSGVFHDVLGVESCDEVVVGRAWESGLDCPEWALPGGVCIASGLVCGNWCAYRQVSPRAHLGK